LKIHYEKRDRAKIGGCLPLIFFPHVIGLFGGWMMGVEIEELLVVRTGGEEHLQFLEEGYGD
jgi:hypothetical protein